MTRDELFKLSQSAFDPPPARLVFGEGPARARVMLIGEAPGEKEEEAGRPFVGKAGSNLDAFLSAARLDRGSLYVTNTVKLRPYRVSAAGNRVNRPPTAREVEFFLPFLIGEIDEIRPQWIVTLGNTPLKALLGKTAVIGEMHGRAIPFRARMLFPMYHPASLLYNRALTGVYEADMKTFASLLRDQ